ncbi:MaoC family dehydratase [Gordonia westfalica]|uniref:Acyl dehydratase n=1 Tax=Gordonia westfalica TaxID=158898 RepID=A0A1H2LEX5_9ACTN|nr:MaoC/PaaZ C-terminal domain-containing protein [Gordonia westfalica]SDU79275.1 Acyl dehydratase [Gordonia westfalica]
MALSTAPRVGDDIPTFQVDSVNADKIRIMALIFQDPNPIHFDLDAVREAGLGDKFVNQGGVTMAYIINMLTAWTGSRASIRSLATRFTANVFAGDAVEAGGRVTDVRHLDGQTLVDCDVWVRQVSADASPVVAGTATVAI